MSVAKDFLRAKQHVDLWRASVLEQLEELADDIMEYASAHPADWKDAVWFEICCGHFEDAIEMVCEDEGTLMARYEDIKADILQIAEVCGRDILDTINCDVA